MSSCKGLTRWGIVSAGNISHDFVTALSLAADRHVVVAIAARSLDRAKEFSSRHDIPTHYGNYESLAADPNVDVVYVGATHLVHLDICKMMMAAGKNVLCEKPLAMNAKEAREIVESARKNKVFLMEAIWSRYGELNLLIRTCVYVVYCSWLKITYVFRFVPSNVKLRETIASGVIGDVVLSEVSFGIPFDSAGNISKKELGGSSMFFIGIYAINFSQFVHGGSRPNKVVAAGHLFPDEETDSSVNGVLTYDNGGTAIISTNTRGAIQQFLGETLKLCAFCTKLLP
jgi:dihydrodiol dehydrogenase / D-xylose 1-dehydrogenase (NADP)